MRYVGRIVEWNDEKGFGFVTPNGGGDRAFVHIKAFERASKRPDTGELISYEPKKDDRGRFVAASIRFVAQQSENKPSPDSAWPRKTIGASFLTALMFGWAFKKIPIIVPLAYGAMSGLAILLYGMDKSAARKNQWRTPENTLHLVGLLGGWPGALIAQDVFRHKSRKAEFQFVFWVTVVANCGALAWLLASNKAAAINQAIFG